MRRALLPLAPLVLAACTSEPDAPVAAAAPATPAAAPGDTLRCAGQAMYPDLGQEKFLSVNVAGRVRADSGFVEVYYADAAVTTDSAGTDLAAVDSLILEIGTDAPAPTRTTLTGAAQIRAQGQALGDTAVVRFRTVGPLLGPLVVRLPC